MIGKIVSALFVLFWLVVLPDLLRLIWEPLISVIKSISIFGDKNLQVIIILMVATNSLTLLLSNTLMYFIYISKIKYFESLKITKDAWPWQKNPQNWRIMVKRSIFLTVFNTVAINSLVLYFLSLFIKVTDNFQYSVSAWPTKITILSEFLFYMLMCELTAYWPHWALHRYPYLYKIHKEHHQYYQSVSIAAIDAHPIQYIFSNLATTASGFLVLGLFKKVHMVTICLWISFRLLEAIEVHTGYQFSWGILKFLPFKSGTDFHDFHHSHNVGCFGAFFKFTDHLMKTDTEYLKYKNKKQKSA